VLDIGKSSAYRIIKTYMTYRTVTNPDKERRLRCLHIHGTTLLYLDDLLQNNPRLYLDDLQAELDAYCGVEFSLRAILNALRRLG